MSDSLSEATALDAPDEAALKHQISELTIEKAAALESEDYDRAKSIKGEIEALAAEVEAVRAEHASVARHAGVTSAVSGGSQPVAHQVKPQSLVVAVQQGLLRHPPVRCAEPLQRSLLLQWRLQHVAEQLTITQSRLSTAEAQLKLQVQATQSAEWLAEWMCKQVCCVCQLNWDGCLCATILRHLMWCFRSMN